MRASLTPHDRAPVARSTTQPAPARAPPGEPCAGGLRVACRLWRATASPIRDRRGSGSRARRRRAATSARAAPVPRSFVSTPRPRHPHAGQPAGRTAAGARVWFQYATLRRPHRDGPDRTTEFLESRPTTTRRHPPSTRVSHTVQPEPAMDAARSCSAPASSCTCCLPAAARASRRAPARAHSACPTIRRPPPVAASAWIRRTRAGPRQLLLRPRRSVTRSRRCTTPRPPRRRSRARGHRRAQRRDRRRARGLCPFSTRLRDRPPVPASRAPTRRRGSPLPREWDWVLDDSRRHQPLQLEMFPGMRDYYAASDEHLVARRAARSPAAAAGYLPTSRCAFRASSRAPRSTATALIAVMPAGSSEPALTRRSPRGGSILDALARGPPASAPR